MKYSRIDPANESGFAKACLWAADGQYYEAILANGVEIVPLQSQMLVNDITGSQALVQFERKFLFIELDQEPIDPKWLVETPGYEYAEPFRCGVAMVQLNDRRFYINPNGENAFGETFEFAETFHEDRALVANDNRFRILNPHGETVRELEYEQVNPQSAWCWQVTRVRDNEYLSGFVDLDGKEITPIQFDEVGYYQPDVKRIRVGQQGKFGFLDEHAQVAIPIRFDYAEIFDRGKARVALDGRVWFIDPQGQEVPD